MLTTYIWIWYWIVCINSRHSICCRSILIRNCKICCYVTSRMMLKRLRWWLIYLVRLLENTGVIMLLIKTLSKTSRWYLISWLISSMMSRRMRRPWNKIRSLVLKELRCLLLFLLNLMLWMCLLIGLDCCIRMIIIPIRRLSIIRLSLLIIFCHYFWFILIFIWRSFSYCLKSRNRFIFSYYRLYFFLLLFFFFLCLLFFITHWLYWNKLWFHKLLDLSLLTIILVFNQ